VHPGAACRCRSFGIVEPGQLMACRQTEDGEACGNSADDVHGQGSAKNECYRFVALGRECLQKDPREILEGIKGFRDDIYPGTRNST
jgi:hypothetical protein